MQKHFMFVCISPIQLISQLQTNYTMLYNGQAASEVTITWNKKGVQNRLFKWPQDFQAKQARLLTNKLHV